MSDQDGQNTQLDENKSYPNPNDVYAPTQHMSGAPVIYANLGNSYRPGSYIVSIYNGYYHANAKAVFYEATGSDGHLMFGPNFNKQLYDLFHYANDTELDE